VVRRSSLKKRIKTFFALTFLLAESVVAIVLACLLSIFYNYSTKLPKVEDLAVDIRTPVATTIWSQDGVLLGKLDVENRQPITLAEMPKNVINATIAIEDHRFYEHSGLDYQGIARAAWADMQGESRRQGASTLTQQVVRNLSQFGLTREKTLERKLKEAVYAVRLEQLYSKQEILQLYLNNIYYGGGAYGIQAASQTFFGKSASRLSLAEAALLAGLPQRPSDFTPFDHRKAALRRRNDVLDRMLEYGYITRDQYEEAIAEKPHIMPRRQHKNFDFRAPYFTTYVLNGLYQRYGADYVQSGLRIETTLNYKIQRMAENTLIDGLDHVAGYGANQGAMVSLDNNSGYIRAMVGGRSFHADMFNAVTQGRRQPGSTFKLFDYSAAFDTGTANLHTTYRDFPFPFPNDPKHRVVHNYEPGYTYASITCLDAIRHSLNTIAVQAAHAVGIRTVIQYAKKMGITTELAPYLPTALGASAVRPIDLCSAYSVLPAKGNRYLPMAITRITDADGNMIEEPQPQLQNDILKPETVQQMDTAFEAVVTSGTGTLARGSEANGIVENARGKTGTTSDNRDAWFAGYTPELTTVIWVASVHRSKHGITYIQMPGATGGHLCAPIWHDFMLQAVPEQRKFKMPTQVASLDSDAEPVSDEKPVKPKTHPKNEADQTDKAPSNNHPTDITDPDNPASPDGTVPGADGTNTTTDITPTQPSATDPNGLPNLPPSERQGPVAVPPHAVAPTPPPLAANPSPVTTRAATPHPAASPELVTVRICVDSGDLANPYCEVTKTIRVTARQARHMRRCHLHRPPPGEE
jgi:penicillin-binding protein 1A